jgi:hypothetical protein
MGVRLVIWVAMECSRHDLPTHLSENVWLRYGGQAGNWVISLTWQCGGCYV